MPRFFVLPGEIGEGEVLLTGENAHHISRSLRMAAGEAVTVCDGAGRDYLCRLTEFRSDCVRAEILSQEPSASEPPYLIRVYQGLPKGDKLDEVIQKTVECGAGEIIPFESSRCVARVGDGKKEPERTARRNRIAHTAAGQCGRGRLPAVRATCPFSEAVRDAAGAGLALFCYEGEGTQPLGEVLAQARAAGGSGGHFGHGRERRRLFSGGSGACEKCRNDPGRTGKTDPADRDGGGLCACRIGADMGTLMENKSSNGKYCMILTPWRHFA